jgi:hypothetical protein
VVPSGHKWCADCEEVRPLDDFVRTSASKSGFGSYCKPCHNRRGRRALEKVGGSRTYHLTRRYGITAAEADHMLRRQDGLCAICRTAPAAHVDHDHETSAVRALLCFNCNGGLGQFKDDPAVLRAAADYVEEHKRRQRPQPLRTRRDEVTVRPVGRRRSGPPRSAPHWSPMCTRLRAHLDALTGA